MMEWSAPVEDLSVIRFADEADISPNGVGSYYMSSVPVLRLPKRFPFPQSDFAGYQEASLSTSSLVIAQG